MNSHSIMSRLVQPKQSENEVERHATPASTTRILLFCKVPVMRTAYKCRAYPDPEQAAMFGRTFGCVRLVWNKTLAERRRAYRTDGKRTSYKETDAALTMWKKTEELAFLSEVSSVPLQQALRHQHAAFANFYAGRARHPRFKSRHSRQSAHYTRSAFRMKNAELWMAKSTAPLKFVWSFDDVDPATLTPTMVVISRDPDGRWYVTFAADIDTPEALPAAGHAIGIDLGVKDFAVTSDGDRVANPPGIWSARPRTWLGTSGGWPGSSPGRSTAARPRRRSPAPAAKSGTPGETSYTAPAPTSSAGRT